jgi:hypothetical protein
MRSSVDIHPNCTYGWAENAHRVGEIELAVEAPGITPKREAFTRVIERCTVHNTLSHAPEVRIKVASGHSVLGLPRRSFAATRPAVAVSFGPSD